MAAVQKSIFHSQIKVEVYPFHYSQENLRQLDYYSFQLWAIGGLPDESFEVESLKVVWMEVKYVHLL